jgi:acetoin utilization protein AcuC
LDKSAVIYSDDFLQYNFGKQHPLNQTRLKLGFELMKSYGFFDKGGVKVYAPPMAKEEDLLLVHTRDYINYVKNLSLDDRDYYMYGFGPGDNPVFENVYSSSCFHVGGTMKGCDIIMNNEVKHAFSMGGGYHHALPDRASGFCVFNDPAIGIVYLKKKYGLKKILYVDIDAHHGDGVQWIFYSEPSVMTISFHESGRYLFPGTGFVEELGKENAKGTKVNVPLPMNTTDDAYLYAIKEIVVPLAKSFKPEFMMCQCGGDAHYSDPLTHLALTTKAYKEISRIYHELAHDITDGRWLCITGGGYDLLACARIWTVMVSEMSGYRVDENMPDDFINQCKRIMGTRPSRNLMDPEGVVDEERYVMEATKKIVDEVKKHIFPLHSI